MSSAAGVADKVTALERLRHELAHPPFHAFLQLQAVAAEPADGLIVLRLPYRLEFRRASDVGDIHGGVLAAVIDIAAHAAIAVHTGRMAPTIDLRIDYLRPVPGVDLTVTARTLRVGRTIGRADVEITAGPGFPLLAVGRGSFSTAAT
jgi:uncharacterized protein (TIGR00369 family)